MVGDIGYGLVILAFALIMKNKFGTLGVCKKFRRYPDFIINFDNIFRIYLRGIFW